MTWAALACWLRLRQAMGSTAEWDLVRESLRSASIDPTDSGRFVNRPFPGVIEPAFFDEGRATPLLIEWLPNVTDVRLKDALVRHIRNRAAKGVATSLLIDEFTRTQDDGLRWVIGDALQYIATPQQRPLLIPLVRDRRFGTGRQMLFQAIGYLDTPEALEATRAGVSDPDVALHAGSALRRLVPASEAQAILEALATNADASVAKAARLNLKKMRQKAPDVTTDSGSRTTPECES